MRNRLWEIGPISNLPKLDFISVEIHSTQGRTSTERYEVTRKKEGKDKKCTEKLIRKNPKTKGAY